MRLPTLRTSTRYAREAVYIGVGAGLLAYQRLQVQRRAGLLAYQRLQVQRRELEAEWRKRFGGNDDAVEPSPG
jgi:hypothetical protein